MKTLLFTLLIAVYATCCVAQSNAFTVSVTGKGQPVILIPGYSCGGEVWKETVDHLKGRYECHVLTLAGYNGVAPIQAPVLQTVRDELIRYVKTQQLHKPILLGHSLGAFMSLWVSSTEPDLFSKLICVDGVPFISAMTNPTITADSLRRNPMYNPELMVRNFTSTPDSLFAVSQKRAMRMQVTDTLKADLVTSWAVRSDRRTLAETIIEMSLTDLRQDIARITAPTLVLGGQYFNSEPATMRILNEQYEKLPNKQLAVSNTKHFIMYENPQWFYAQIDRFLQSAN
nr:alpha/beta hydrolase [uncultured Arsenicibacter sp.]